jgi:uridylate kinase
MVLKATRVNGVFDADPRVNPDAAMLDDVNYLDVIARRLQVMDSTAITMCMDNDIPIRVFNMTVPGEIARAIRGDDVGTLVH